MLLDQEPDSSIALQAADAVVPADLPDGQAVAEPAASSRSLRARCVATTSSNALPDISPNAPSGAGGLLEARAARPELAISAAADQLADFGAGADTAPSSAAAASSVAEAALRTAASSGDRANLGLPAPMSAKTRCTDSIRSDAKHGSTSDQKHDQHAKRSDAATQRRPVRAKLPDAHTPQRSPVARSADVGSSDKRSSAAPSVAADSAAAASTETNQRVQLTKSRPPASTQASARSTAAKQHRGTAASGARAATHTAVRNKAGAVAAHLRTQHTNASASRPGGRATAVKEGTAPLVASNALASSSSSASVTGSRVADSAGPAAGVSTAPSADAVRHWSAQAPQPQVQREVSNESVASAGTHSVTSVTSSQAEALEALLRRASDSDDSSGELVRAASTGGVSTGGAAERTGAAPATLAGLPDAPDASAVAAVTGDAQTDLAADEQTGGTLQPVQSSERSPQHLHVPDCVQHAPSPRSAGIGRHRLQVPVGSVAPPEATASKHDKHDDAHAAAPVSAAVHLPPTRQRASQADLATGLHTSTGATPVRERTADASSARVDRQLIVAKSDPLRAGSRHG